MWGSTISIPSHIPTILYTLRQPPVSYSARPWTMMWGCDVGVSSSRAALIRSGCDRVGWRMPWRREAGARRPGRTGDTDIPQTALREAVPPSAPPTLSDPQPAPTPPSLLPIYPPSCSIPPLTGWFVVIPSVGTWRLQPKRRLSPPPPVTRSRRLYKTSQLPADTGESSNHNTSGLQL